LAGHVFQANIVVHSVTLLGDEITGALRIEPTKVLNLGEPHSLGDKTREFTSWILSSPLDPEAPIDEHLTWLLDTIAPANERIRELALADTISARIQAAFRHTGQYPMTFLNDLLDKLARFPGHFWLTAYSEAETEPEE